MGVCSRSRGVDPRRSCRRFIGRLADGLNRCARGWVTPFVPALNRMHRDHRFSQRRMPDAMDGTLSPRQQARFARHVGECPECGPMLRSLIRVRAALRTIPRADQAPRTPLSPRYSTACAASRRSSPRPDAGAAASDERVASGARAGNDAASYGRCPEGAQRDAPTPRHRRTTPCSSPVRSRVTASRSRISCAGTPTACTRSWCGSSTTATTPRRPRRRRSCAPGVRSAGSRATASSSPGSTGSASTRPTG